MLHILRHSPYDDDRLASCLRVLNSHQALLLIEDAVYALMPRSSSLASLGLLPPSIKLYVLEADLQARGMALDSLPERVTRIDYLGMVELCAQSNKVLSW
ncbi:MAG: sulfurtransferase complex subunit TusB [Pseudomonas sp.]